MSTPVITFFNNKSGVGKTSLVYHLSWMFAEMGVRMVAVDLDPQANLTAAFLTEDDLESLWERQTGPSTIYRAVQPLTAVGDLLEPVLTPISPHLHLMAGDVALSGFEETLSSVWSDSMGDNNLYRPFRILTAFWQIAQMAAQRVQADLIIADVGPNLGAINRSALIGTDFVVIPLGADLFSLQGLKNLGSTLRSWRSLWGKRLNNLVGHSFPLPAGSMNPLGYVVQQHGIRLSRPVKAYDRWVNRMPSVYHSSVLDDDGGNYTPASDPSCLATLKHYRSLVPMAQEAPKPIFELSPADGAIGNHAVAVKEARADFLSLARVVLARMGNTHLLVAANVESQAELAF
jgi:chromosome partitioning protein